jgi:hypothetical protein
VYRCVVFEGDWQMFERCLVCKAMMTYMTTMDLMMFFVDSLMGAMICHTMTDMMCWGGYCHVVPTVRNGCWVWGRATKWGK